MHSAALQTRSCGLSQSSGHACLCFASPVSTQSTTLPPRSQLLKSPVKHALCQSISLRKRQFTTAVALSAAAKAAAATTAAKATAAGTIATAATAASAALPAWVTTLVAAATAYTAACFLGMLLLPERVMRPVMESFTVFLPLAAVYTVLLIHSWSPDTLSLMMPGSIQEGLAEMKPQFFPKLDGIMTLFGRALTTASLVVHILAINLFMGRTCYLDGLRSRVPTWHTLIFSAVAGPVGLLSHYFTKMLSSAVPALRKDEKPVVLSTNDGTITIFPYTEATDSK